jgi:hypothetical protein
MPKTRFVAIALVLLAASLVAVLVACPPATPKKAPPAVHPPQRLSQTPSPDGAGAFPEHPRPEREGQLALVIDDAGYSLEELQAFLDLPGPLTVAVLPNLPHSREAARMVLAAGKDLILHCPMEPQGSEDPGPGAILVGLSQQEIEARLAQAFASVPGAQGMNNHMGSKATTDTELMTVVLAYLKREGKYFFDSRTTPDTVGPRIAQSLGVPFAQRDLFIDHDTSAEQVAAAWDRGIEEAKNRGTAIVIGHVQNRAVLDIVRNGEGELSGRRVQLARLVDVIAQRERNSVE